MRHFVYRLLSTVYVRWPADPGRKEAVKAFIYRNFGPLFRGSRNFDEWRRANPTHRAPKLASRSVAPDHSAWAALSKQTRSSDSDVLAEARGRPYVVVPVYRGRSETLACLYGIRLSSPSVRLVVIDDASPDARLAKDLRDLADAGHFELLHNPTNSGFLHSVNRGLRLDPEADVVLVNSDTEVYGDWLRRLNAAAYRAPDVGTVTPLSNNGDIASYPRAQIDNRGRLELDFSQVDALASEANEGLSVEVPTGVGYCFYIRRACLRDTGLFDARFNAGYGEENDFCQRARASGWRNVIAGDVYVRHAGSVSFGARASSLRHNALAMLVDRYPAYLREVEDFQLRDPLRSVRLRLDAARLRRSHPVQAPIRSLLFVVHDWGGGVEEHIRELAKRLSIERVAVYGLRVRRRGETLGLGLEGSPGAPSLDQIPTIEFLPLEARGELAEALRVLEIDHVHLHHAGELSGSGFAWLKKACVALGASYDVTLHDYAAICPRLHLEDPSGRYCGQPGIDECRRCLNQNGSRFGAPDLEIWRREWRSLLAGARLVFCATEDLHRRMAARWPEPNYVVRGHPEAPSVRVVSRTETDFSNGPSSGHLRVLVPGAINEQKGLALLIDCAKDARARSLPLEFWIVGYSRDDRRARRAGINLTGRHASGATDAEIARVLRSPSVVFLPSLSPETWSYALSAALRVGVQPVVFDLGALAERVLSSGWGTVLPFALADCPAALNDALLLLRDGPAKSLKPTSRLPNTHYNTLLTDYYGGLGESPTDLAIGTEP